MRNNKTSASAPLRRDEVSWILEQKIRGDAQVIEDIKKPKRKYTKKKKTTD